MTGVLETPFGRRSLLRGAVGLAVALVLPAATQRPANADDATDSTRIVPGGNATGSYLVLAPGEITVYAGKVELGTGVQTALSQVVLDELHLPWQPISYVQGDTLLTTDEGYTAGSKTTQVFGVALRRAAATAFQALLATAAAQAGVGTAQLKVKNGVVSYRSYRATYDQLLAAAGTRVLPADPRVPLRDPGDYAVVGSSVDRVDLPAKTLATFPFVCDVTVPGMLHGRVARPAGRNAHLASYDDTAARKVPGVVGVYQQQDFLGVVATSEYAAAAGAAALSATWTPGPPLWSHDQLPQVLRDPGNSFAQNTKDPLNTGDPDAALTTATTVLRASYDTPFHMHGTVGSSSAVADVRTDSSGTVQSVEAWSGTQGVFPLARALALLVGTTTDRVTVHYAEASGCYGHDGADDATADAALLSLLAGAPVRVQWTRAQEHGWEPLGSAMAHDLVAGLDAQGNVVAWEHTVNSAVHNARPTALRGSVLAGTLTGSAPAALSPNPFDNAARNAPVTYAFPNRRLVTNLVKTFAGTTDLKGNLVAASPLTYYLPRTTALRSLGGFSNTFANESFLDELAHAAGRDPLEMRRSALAADPRALAVLDALAPAWRQRPTGSGVGAGLAYQQYEVLYTYVAVYAEALVDPATGAVRVPRVVVAHDCGLVINPDGLRHQIEGNVIQGVSRTLHEDVRYSADTVTSVNWETNAFVTDPANAYPVIRFDEVPQVEVLLLDRPAQPAWGAGEPAIGPVGAAIANAVFAASGRRVRRLPMTPDRVLATPVTA